VDGPSDARGKMSILTGGSTAIMAVLVKLLHGEILRALYVWV
jgi:hypothetical protein